MDSRTRAYVPLGDETPQDMFKKAMSFFHTVHDKVAKGGEEGVQIVTDTLTRQLAYTIFGSNYIERAGLGLEETIKICERIFRGEKINAEDIPQR